MPLIISKRVGLAALCLVIPLLMAFGPLLPHSPQHASPDPIVLASPDHGHEHGHEHGPDEHHEGGAGHAHDHNPADHSHDTPATPGSAPVVPSLDQTWTPMPPRTADHGAGHPLERPPRPIAIA